MEFLKQLLAAVGGGVGITLVILALFKTLFQRWFENVIITSSQKTIIKLTNSLQRSTRAYEMVLDKEFEFYERTSNVVSDLAVNIQDLLYYITLNEDTENSKNIDAARKVLLSILESIPKYKNDNMVYGCYITQDINEAATKIIKDLQDDMNVMTECFKSANDKMLSEVQEQKLKITVDRTLMNCALITTLIKSRLIKLSE